MRLSRQQQAPFYSLSLIRTRELSSVFLTAGLRAGELFHEFPDDFPREGTGGDGVSYFILFYVHILPF